MKTGKLRGVLMSMLLGAVPLFIGGCCPFFNGVYIPDQNLELALREALGQPFGCLSASDLANLTELQADSRNITSLEGLESCTSLTVLSVRDNLITTITPLTNLKNLVRVDLTDNAVHNIEPIAGWQNLDELDLVGDLMEIVDWSPLAANVNAARGLGAGDVVTLPTATTVDGDGNALPNFADTLQALQNAGVHVIIGTTATGTGTGK